MNSKSCKYSPPRFFRHFQHIARETLGCARETHKHAFETVAGPTSPPEEDAGEEGWLDGSDDVTVQV